MGMFRFRLEENNQKQETLILDGYKTKNKDGVRSTGLACIVVQ